MDEFAPRLSFFFGIGMNFFMEVAKLRAARLLWAELMQELFRPKDPRSLMLRTHCQTSGVSLTSKDPYNNIVRTTIEALAAVLGGTQSLHTNSFDEALALPTPFSAHIARNTQLVIQEETGHHPRRRPAGGLVLRGAPHRIAGAEEARKLIREVEKLGGMTRAVESGMPKMRIEQSAALRQARIDRGEEVIVGVNKYPLDGRARDRDPRHRQHGGARIPGRSACSACARRATRRPARPRSTRLTRAAETKTGNLLELAIVAARARASVGEISDALEKVYGRHRAVIHSISGVYGSVYAGDEDF